MFSAYDDDFMSSKYYKTVNTVLFDELHKVIKYLSMVYLHCEEHNRQAELKQSLIKTYLENIEELKTNLCKYIDSQAKAQIDFADNGESVFMPFYFG